MINKNTIIYFSDILGNLTIEDLIYYLESLIKSQSEFEDIIYNILKYKGYDDETISSLLIKNSLPGIKFILDIITDSL